MGRSLYEEPPLLCKTILLPMHNKDPISWQLPRAVKTQ